MATDAPTYNPTDQANKPGDGPLRVGGQPVAESLTPQEQQNLPSTQNHQRVRQGPGLKLVRDLWEGAEKVRDMGHEYLPQAPGEDAANYAIRLKRSVYHNFYRRTVEGLTGLIFRKDPVLGEDVPPLIAEHWENIDLCGTHGDVFLRDTCLGAAPGCAPSTTALSLSSTGELVGGTWLPALSASMPPRRAPRPHHPPAQPGCTASAPARHAAAGAWRPRRPARRPTAPAAGPAVPGRCRG